MMSEPTFLVHMLHAAALCRDGIFKIFFTLTLAQKIVNYCDKKKKLNK